MDLFGGPRHKPGDKLKLTDPTVVAYWKEWETSRRALLKQETELDIQDAGLEQEIAILKEQVDRVTAEHEKVVLNKKRIESTMKALRGRLWLSIMEAEPAFDMSQNWTLVREESNGEFLTIMRDINQDEMVRDAVLKMLSAERSERKVGFGR